MGFGGGSEFGPAVMAFTRFRVPHRQEVRRWESGGRGGRKGGEAAVGGGDLKMVERGLGIWPADQESSARFVSGTRKKKGIGRQGKVG